MSSKEEAYYTLLLRQYIEGTISKEDRFILEKRALDDPFLFEALEGYQSNNEQYLESLKLLRSKFSKNKQVKQSKRIPLFNYGIAASLILILGIGLWVFTDVVSSEENIAMNTAVIEENNYNQKPLDVIVASETKDLNVKPANKQYDTPKAVISQRDNEAIRQQSKVKQTTTQVIEPTKTYIQQQTTPSIKNNQTITPENENKPSPTDDLASILNQDKVDLQSDVQLIEEDQLAAEASKEEGQPIGARSQTAEVIYINDDALSKDDYYKTIDGKIMVAPVGGISKLLNISRSKLDDQKRKRGEFNNQQFSTISFRLTPNGEPIDLKLITTDNIECGKNLLTAIEKERKWITIPESYELTIVLKLPCN